MASLLVVSLPGGEMTSYHNRFRDLFRDTKHQIMNNEGAKTRMQKHPETAYCIIDRLKHLTSLMKSNR